MASHQCYKKTTLNEMTLFEELLYQFPMCYDCLAIICSKVHFRNTTCYQARFCQDEDPQTQLYILSPHLISSQLHHTTLGRLASSPEPLFSYSSLGPSSTHQDNPTQHFLRTSLHHHSAYPMAVLLAHTHSHYRHHQAASDHMRSHTLTVHGIQAFFLRSLALIQTENFAFHQSIPYNYVALTLITMAYLATLYSVKPSSLRLKLSLTFPMQRSQPGLSICCHTKTS